MKLLFVVVGLAMGISFAGDPTDMDSLFRGNEYSPELNASLRDTSATAGPAISGKASTDKKASKDL